MANFAIISSNGNVCGVYDFESLAEAKRYAESRPWRISVSNRPEDIAVGLTINAKEEIPRNIMFINHELQNGLDRAVEQQASDTNYQRRRNRNCSFRFCENREALAILARKINYYITTIDYYVKYTGEDTYELLSEKLNPDVIDALNELIDLDLIPNW